jgi:DNA-binding XRE family transcriptional regulator
MADEVVEQIAPFPNNLRTLREQDSLTRHALKLLCDSFAETDPIRYKSVGLTTLRDLELGLSQPKMRTASTISAALNLTVGEIFPLGIESPYKNPSGKTSITPGRAKGGRKPKEEKS